MSDLSLQSAGHLVPADAEQVAPSEETQQGPPRIKRRYRVSVPAFTQY